MKALAAAREISALIIKCLEESGIDVPLHCLPTDECVAEIIERHMNENSTTTPSEK